MAKKIYGLLFALLSLGSVASAQVSGVKSIPGDYSSLAAAVNDLNANGVGAGGAVINVAAGYTETAPAGGYLLGTATLNASLSATNTLTIQKNGTGNNPLITANAGTSTTLDFIFGIQGADYLTIDGIDLSDPATNTTAATAMEYGYAFVNLSAADGCQNNTVKNCKITFPKLVNTYAIAIDFSHHTATSVTVLTIATTTGLNSNNKVYSNTVTGCNSSAISFTGFAAASPYTYYDQNNDIGGSSAATGNIVANFGGSPGGTGYITGYALYAVYQNLANVSYNSVTNDPSTGFLGGIGIYAFGVNSTFTCNNNNISLNGLTYYASSSSLSTHAGIYCNSTGSNLTANNNNINLVINGVFSGTAQASYGILFPGTGNFTAIGNTIATSHSVSSNFYSIYSGSTAAVNISNNNITANTGIGGISGIYLGIYLPAAATSQVISGNNFNNMLLNTTGTIYMIYNSNNTANFTVSNNTISNINKPLQGGTFYGYYSQGAPGTGTGTITGNTFNNIVLLGTTGFYGIRHAASASQTNVITNNTISNITGGSTTMFGISHGYGAAGSVVSGNAVFGFSSTGAITGINLGDGSGSASLSCFGNRVNTLSTTGASAVIGINSGVGTVTSIYKNKIYDLQSSGTASTVYGIAIAGGTASSTNNTYNNLIGDLRTPNTASTADAIRGISITSSSATSNIYLYYNTIYLNATSTGTNFSTSGIYHTTSTTATTAALTMRNNLVYNGSTPRGTGLAIAYRRSSATLTNYQAASSNNMLYAGTPSTTNLLYYDGTNSIQTIAALQTLVTPREAASVSEATNFISTNGSNQYFLHVNPAFPTLCDGGAAVIAGITDDYDGDIRNVTTPDIGADEFTLCPAYISGTTGGTICGNGTVNLSAVGVEATSYLWYNAAFGGTLLATTASGSWTTPSLSATTTYYVAASNGTCESPARIAVTATVNPNPSTPVVTPVTATAICIGSNQPLFVLSPSLSTTLFSEDFEDGTLGGFTATTSGAPWTNYTSPSSILGGQNVSSGSRYVASNADAYPVVSTSTLTTTNSFNTVGYTGLTLSFRHYYRYFNYYSPDQGYVEISTDGGNTWTTLQMYSATIGSAANFATATINLNSYINQTNLKLRFRMNNFWNYGWAIDDVILSGSVLPLSYSWSSVPSVGGGLPLGSGVLSSGNSSIVAVPVSTGSSTTYVYTATVSNGLCSVTKDAGSVTVLNPSSVATAQGPTTICADQSVVLHGSSDIGTTYSWYRVGSGTVLATTQDYTATTDGEYYVVSGTTSPAVCSKESNHITVTTVALVTPSVSIVSSMAGDSICAGSTMTFTPAVTNGGTTPLYQWKKGGANIAAPAGTASTYSYVPVNGDQISLVVTSTASCPRPATATSNTIGVIVKPVLVPTITISASGNNICAGTSVTYTATITNGGTTPSYQWTKGGVDILGANNATYTYVPQNGDVIRCRLVSSYMCPNPGTLTSTGITMTVYPLQTPAVTVSANPGTTVCAGTGITYSANVTNGGSSPQYAWYINNVLTSSSNAFVAGSVSNGTVVKVVLTSNALCASPATATDSVTMTVNPNLTPSVTITAAPGDSVCQGTGVTFTAVAVNGGTAPQYQWKKNGVNVTGTGNTYTSTNLVNGDKITCVLTSNAACLATTQGTSNEITMRITTPVTPTITISASPGSTVCPGTQVLFVSSITNGGTNAQYQWYKGSTAINGATGATYTTNTLANGDVISCRLVSSYSCVTGSTATSSGITMTLNAAPSATITTVGATTFCSGDSVVLRGNPTGGYSYVWYNGTTVVGVNGTYTARTSGSYTVVVTNNSTLCQGTSAATAVTVNALPAATISYTGSSNICTGSSLTLNASPTGSGYSYQWLQGSTVVGGNTASYTATAAGSYRVQVTNTGTGCVGTSPAAAVTVSPRPGSAVSAGGATTFCAGGSVVLSGSPAGSGYSYQWLQGSTVVGSGSSYTATTAGSYRVSVTNTATGCVDTSTSTTVTVNSLPDATVTAGGATTLCSGSSVTLSAAGGTGLSYQWLKNGSAISPGGTAQSYVATSGGNYTVRVTNTTTGCVSTTGTATTVVVNPTPVASITALSDTTFCQGSQVVLSSGVTIAGYAYQWQRNGISINGATGNVYSATMSGLYRVVITQGSCNGTSNGITVTANAAPLATISYTGSPTICSGQSLVLTAPSGSGYSYQWKKDGHAISPGGTSASYTATGGGNYMVTITSGNCSGNSTPVTITETALPDAVISTSGPTGFCVGGSVTLSAPAGAGNTYQWYLNGIIPLTTTSTYTATSGGNYTVRVTNAGGCSQSSAAVGVSVGTIPPAVLTASGATTLCTGGSVTLQAATGSGLSYEWYRDNSVLTGVSGSSYTTGTSGSYHIVVTNGSGCSASSAPLGVTTEGTPDARIVTGSAGTDLCGPDGTLVLNSYPSQQVVSYQWRESAADIAGATDAYYMVSHPGSYTLLVRTLQGHCSAETAAPVVVGIHALPGAGFTNTNGLLQAQTGYVSYQWYLNGVMIVGATGSSYQASAAGYYSVEVTDGAHCSNRTVPAVYVSLGSTGVGTVSVDQIRVYPNPVVEELVVEAPVGVQLRLLGVDGKEVLRSQGVTTRLRVGQLANGLYLLQILDNKGAIITTKQINKLNK